MAEAPGAVGGGDGCPRQVVLRGVPVAVLLRSRRHSDGLVRELALLGAEGGTSPGARASRRVGQLFAEFAAAHRPFVEQAQARLDEAAGTGADVVDIAYEVDGGTRAAALALLDLLGEIDELCRQGALLTLVTPDDVASFRRWYLLEFDRQIGGAPPTPWPG